MKSLLPFAGIFFAIFILSNGFPSDDHAHEHESERRMHPGVYRRADARQQDEYEKKEHWFENAKEALESKLKVKKIEKQAKNIIFFLGDGMSVPTVTAARIFKGQQDVNIKFGEEASLHFDSFPNIGVSKTFCADSQTADSACSATAYLCGTKANDATIGVSPDVKLRDCVAQMNKDNQVSSILAWSQDAGKSTGVVTTARVTHASPAGAYAHIAARDWEDDSYIASDGVDPETCDDIAEQLIRNAPGKDINVIFGGGRWRFLPNTTEDSEGGRGYRRDGVDLIEEWKTKHTARSSYIENITQLAALNVAETDFVLGLFSGSHVAYLDKQAEDNDPSLEEMTRKAIEILSKNENGYFLFVEGGRIDHAHHDTNAQRALWETIEFDKAIKLADQMTSVEDTIILVTSDHAHVMSLAGYPPRGNPLLKDAGKAGDGLQYPTLSYANGPGHKNHTIIEGQCVRYNISTDDMELIDYLQPTMAEINSETHGGDDVLIFSRGPYAHLLTGVQQQSYIPHALAYAACIGNGLKCCDTGCTPDSGQGSSAPQSLFISFYLVLTVATYHVLKNI